ncbi:UNVERIFIED_CONTAM: hypothetical protein GTU68_010718 [Idotea baltica]|nr:hypothetical protein [Idotea baltica]
MSQKDLAIIVGGSHAAAQLCQSLRQEQWSGRILVISDDPHLPYHRPPLSKEYLSGDKQADNLLIRPAAAYEKFDIEFMLNTRVEKIDRASKTVQLNSGETLSYTKLALCTGARVRKLPIEGSDLKGVHYLRDLGDAEAIKQDIQPGIRAVIIGGGYIGLETAALLRKVGLDVCILETMDRVLQRVTSKEISAFYARVHTEEGVVIKTNAVAEKIVGAERVEAVICDNGESVAADLVIIGIGVVPNTELAEEIGLTVENGIVVDEYAQTSDKNIVAAGDCTVHPNPIYGRNIRLESVPNASEQAKSAAASMCGVQKVYGSLPWFWSNQYDLKLQIAGLNQGFDEVHIRGDLSAGRSFVAWYLKGGNVIAADCVNRPVEFMLAKKLIQSGQNISIEDLTNNAIEPKALMAALI